MQYTLDPRVPLFFPRAHIILDCGHETGREAPHRFDRHSSGRTTHLLLDLEGAHEPNPFGDRLEDALDVLVELDGLVARLLLLEVQSNYYKSKKVKISYILKRKEYFASNI